jgi:Ca2+-binding RTX toxin-like protein
VPNTATRTIDVVINDGTSSSVAATSHITINAINDNDTLTGTAGADTINGDAGNDTINALAGNDTVNGGDGNDIINGGQGADFLQGGNGDDSFIISFNDGIDNIVGGAGSDTYDASAITANITIDVSSFAGSTLVDIGTDTNETVSGVENFILGSGNNILNMLLASTASNFLFNGTAGTDTIDYSAYNANSINSNLGANDVNVVGGGVHTIQGFENIIGTQLNDTIIGSAVGNVISGGMGNDNLSGGAGNDVLNGSTGDDSLAGGTGDDTLDGDIGIDVANYVSSTTAVSVNLAVGTATGEGNDTLSNIENISGSNFNDTLTGDANNNVLIGNSGDDNINGGAGDDFLLGGLGNDALDGGAGVDTADYSAIKTAVTVDLNIGTASGEGNDTLTNIENINGSAFDDTLIGDANNNVINAGDGNDLIEGSFGTDSLDGGNGNDTLDYTNLPATVGISVDMLAGTSDTGDTFSNIENVTGSTFNDALSGDNNNNTINGGDGDDTLNGRDGNDTLDGGNGFDTADYSSSTVSVNVDLGAGTASGNGNDTLISIENILGSAQSDILTGDANSNDITGGDGNDQIDGRGGIDTINGGNGDDVIAGDGNDTLDGGAGIDTLDYFSLGGGVTVDLSIDSSSTGDSITNFENVNGTSSNDDLTGDVGNNALSGGAGDDVLSGGLGNDTLDGGTGIDVADYSGVTTGGVTVDLSAGTSSGEGNDSLISIENVIGSAFNDTIIGDANNNIFFNSDGNDTLDGGAGNDLLYYDGTINPITIDNGSNYSITAIEHLDFQTNGTTESITVTVQDSMVFNNVGNFLLIEIDDLDSFSIDFSTNTSGWNFNGSGVNWQEYEKAGMVIRIESVTDTSNIAVTGAEGLPISLNDILSGANTTDGFGYQETTLADRGYGGIIASIGGDAGISGEGDDFVVFAEDPLEQTVMIGFDGSFTSTGIGATLTGTDLSRKSASGAGDFNGDGYLDIILGAPNDGASATGEAQILFGTGTGAFNSGDLTLAGMSTGDATGMSVAGVGDINGDGFADVIIGSPGTGSNNGSAYIIFGDDYTGSNSIDVTTLGDPIFAGGQALDGSAITSLDIEISETFTGGTTGFVLKSDGLLELYDLNDAAAPTLINSPLNDTDGSFNGTTTFDIEALAGYTGGTDPLTNAVDIVSKGDFLFILSD